MIALFAYDFPHRKTHDFIVELNLLGLDFIVLAAPFRELKLKGQDVFFERTLQSISPINTRELCENLEIPYFRVEHDNFLEIQKIAADAGCNFGLVSGARIISGEVIDIFSKGILNLHPGKIPETSGLDAFFYAIKKSCSMGVTGHFIDYRVDAGEFIFFEELVVGLSDSIETVSENLYRLQIRSLRKYIPLALLGLMPRHDIDRPEKNCPLTVDEKKLIVSGFSHWRQKIHIEQRLNALLESCKVGDTDAALKIINALPSLINAYGKNGWNAIIVSGFHGHHGLVHTLLEMGADPNSVGKNGTTVLMYSKTKLLNKKGADYSLLTLLLDHGASLDAEDCYGRNIFYYIKQSGDREMDNFLKKSWSV